MEYFNSNGEAFPDTKIRFLNQYGNELFKKKKYSESLRIRINSKFKITQKFRIIDETSKNSSQGTGIIVKKIENLILTIGDVFANKPKYIP